MRYSGSVVTRSGNATTGCKEKSVAGRSKTLTSTDSRWRSSTIRNPKDKYGFRAMSPFSAHEYERVDPSGVAVQKKRSDSFCGKPHNRIVTLNGFAGRQWQSGTIDEGIITMFPQLKTLSTGLEQSEDLLAMRAEANLANAGINILQIAAFLPATLKNILTNLRNMDALLDALHDRKRLAKLLGRDFGGRSLYLQFLFVWNQLYRDIVNSAAYLQRKSIPIGSLVTGRSRNTGSVSAIHYGELRYDPSPQRMGLTTCTLERTVSQRAVSIARVTCDLSYSYNATGLDNPLYLGWDLMKWTWVIDQFIDVGLFISSLTSLHGLQFLGTSVTTRRTCNGIVTVAPYVNDLYDGTAEYSPGYSRRKTITRNVRKSPTKSVTIRNPFQNNIMVTAAVAAAVSMRFKTNVPNIARLGR